MAGKNDDNDNDEEASWTADRSLFQTIHTQTKQVSKNSIIIIYTFPYTSLGSTVTFWLTDRRPGVPGDEDSMITYSMSEPPRLRASS